MSFETLNNMDDLLNMSMEDLPELPPRGVPPTGSYDLEVSAKRVEGEDGKAGYLSFEFTVLAVKELKHEEEAADPLAKVGAKFTENFFPIKKDNTANETGMGFLRERLATFAATFGTTTVGDTLAAVNQVKISASLTRVQDKKNEDQFNARLKDVVLL